MTLRLSCFLELSDRAPSKQRCSKGCASTRGQSTATQCLSVSFSLPYLPPSLLPSSPRLSPACACVHTHRVNELNFLHCEEFVCTWAYVLKFWCLWILVGMRIQDVYHLAKSQHSVILSLINRWRTGFHKKHCLPSTLPSEHMWGSLPSRFPLPGCGLQYLAGCEGEMFWDSGP